MREAGREGEGGQGVCRVGLVWRLCVVCCTGPGWDEWALPLPVCVGWGLAGDCSARRGCAACRACWRAELCTRGRAQRAAVCMGAGMILSNLRRAVRAAQH